MPKPTKTSALSTKRLQIDKSRSNLVIIVAVAAFVTVFSLVSIRALLVKRSFQGRVVAEKEATLKTLKENNTAAAELTTAFKAFNETPDNLLGGNPEGSGDKDGDNAKLVLDALPGHYDFPALVSSIEKMIEGNKNGTIEGITGTDDEVTQSQASDSSVPVEMPFQVAAKADPDGLQTILQTFSRSIRPMVVTTLNITAEDANSLNIDINAKSYYQPKKTLSITSKEVR
jgi:hypothetical protein